jgi:hypothetical protein
MHGPCGDRGLGLALIRDCYGARAFDTLLRYRGGTLAELWRALRTLKALQAEAARPEPAAMPAPRLLPEPNETPIEPEARRIPREIAPAPAGGEVVATVVAQAPPAQRRQPIEPETRGNPGERAPAPAADAKSGRVHGDLGAQVTQKCVTNAPLGGPFTRRSGVAWQQRSTRGWCRRQDLNPQPPAYKADALPLSYAGMGSYLGAAGMKSKERRTGSGAARC